MGRSPMPRGTLKGIAELSVLKVREILKSLKNRSGNAVRYEKDPIRRGGDRNETHPIDSLLDGISSFHNGNINLIIHVLSIRSRHDLLVPLLVLGSEILTSDKQRKGGSGTASTDS
jgi:hypothetical protein